MSTTTAPLDAQDQPQNLKIVFPPTSPPQHRRGYQACDPCRKRKVKCDLGSVDNPRPPPCVRCRRESKRCEFSATRRKRKASEDADDATTTTASQAPNSPLRRDKRMMVADGTYPEQPAPANGSSSTNNTNTFPPAGESSSMKSENGSTYPQWPEMSPGVGRGSISEASQPRLDTSLSPTQVQGYRQPPNTAYPAIGRPGNQSFLREGGQHMMNKTAAELLSPAISNSHDALHLLSEAAGRTEDLNRQSLENRYAANQSSSSNFGSQSSHMGRQSVAGSRVSNARVQKPGSTRSHYQGTPLASVIADHDVQNDSSVGLEDPGYLSAMRAWSRLRFVRAGWFTIDEAMAYISYYYKHLAPLTPIVLPNYSLPSTHLTLLTDEPILTVTLLTIASRHMELSGNGAKSRAYSIHERLWSYLRGMIERLFWGQEKFGGSVSGINLAKYREVCPPTGKGNLKGHLRSLGTVEALLLLTDWHPRALHFPPGDDENTLLDMDAHILSHINDESQEDEQNQRNQGNASDGTPLALYKWLEPAWRSDRMSWMLLSTAQALAFELGVFDQKNESDPADSPASQTRKRRARRLILVYVTQSSGRLGISSMLPLPQWTKDTDPLYLEDIGAEINEDAAVDAMHDCWMEISKIMFKSNQQLFLTKEQTSELIRSGRYRDEINEFVPALKEFKKKFDRLPMAPPMRNILTIEYEYTRLYVNCLALQAVVDRWTTMTNDPSGGPVNSESTPAAAASGTGQFRVLMEQYRVNEPYIQEVVDASRKILTTVLEGLAPGDCLKHAPVRTYFRILSGMIFILKTFTLGAKEDDVRVSLELQDRTVECLRTCVVDDVHLSVTISDLLQLLTANIRTRFLRFAPLDRAGDDGRENTPNASRQQSPYPQDNNPQNRTSTNTQWQPNLDGYSVDNNNGNNMFANTPGRNDPLANIPAQPINSSNLNVAFMPPPASFYNFYDNNNSNNTNTNNPNSTPPAMDITDPTLAPQASGSVQDNTNGPSGNNNTNSAALPDWFALPLDQFFNSSTAGVDQGLGGTGPMVGELDMLEVLLNEQYDRDSTTGGGQQPSSSHFM